MKDYFQKSKFDKIAVMKFLIPFFLFLFLQFSVRSQTTNLSIEISNAPFEKMRFSYINPYDFDKPQRFFEQELINGNTKFLLDIHRFTVVQISGNYLVDSVEQYFEQKFYLTPGDDLVYQKNFSVNDNSYRVVGKGANNNQPLYFEELDFEKYGTDTLPHHFIKSISEMHESDKKNIQQYVGKNKPSLLFQNFLRETLKYKTANLYTSFWGSHKFYFLQNPRYDSNKYVWEKAKDSILSTIQLNNPKALMAPDYTWLIALFMIRKKEELWDSLRVSPTEVHKHWFSEMSADSATASLAYDSQNELQERIINRYFSGAPAEFLYEWLFLNMKSFGKKRW